MINTSTKDHNGSDLWEYNNRTGRDWSMVHQSLVMAYSLPSACHKVGGCYPRLGSHDFKAQWTESCVKQQTGGRGTLNSSRYRLLMDHCHVWVLTLFESLCPCSREVYILKTVFYRPLSFIHVYYYIEQLICPTQVVYAQQTWIILYSLSCLLMNWPITPIYM